MAVGVGIVGVSGYTGVELHRLLSTHPGAEITAVMAGNAAGKPLAEVWPGLTGLSMERVESMDLGEIAERCDAVFLALPHGVSASIAPGLVASGVRVFDLGADFRLKDPEVYASAYGHPHPHPEVLPLAVYGLPELHREALRGAKLVACPGCYPTAVAIAALPLVEAGLCDWLIADCLSGISGAGRQPGPRNLYCEVQESAVAYNIAGAHRHTPEIEQILGLPVTFTPHLVPMVRGMIATVHGRLSAPTSASELRKRFAERYHGHPMVVLRDAPPATADVRGSNRAHVHVAVDERRGVVTVTAAIDNLVKGAAGQAIQCFNLSFGLPEAQGLPLIPILP